MNEQLYKYVWGDDKTAVGVFRKRHYKGRICRILACGAFNSCLIEFVDNRQQLNCSRPALRKIDETGPEKPAVKKEKENQLCLFGD